MRCKHCRSTELIEDYARGIIVCSNCAIVHSHQIISDKPEWRSYSAEDAFTKSRVGDPLQVGIPERLQLRTYTSFNPNKRLKLANHQREDDEYRMYMKNRRNLERLCQEWEMPSHAVTYAYQIFSIVRETKEKIRYMDCLHAAIIYHVGYMVSVAIPYNVIVRRMNCNKKMVGTYLRKINLLIHGELENRNVSDVVFQTLPRKNDIGLYTFPEFYGKTLIEKVEIIINYFCHHFKVQRDTRIRNTMDVVCRLFFNQFPTTTRHAETIGTGIFYHVMKWFRLNEETTIGVKLSVVSSLMGISDSSVNDMIRELPPLKSKRKSKH